MKPTTNYGLSDSLIDAVRKSVEEALVGGQKKLDVDKDGKLEKSDFASLRAKKDAVNTKPKLKEEDEQIDEAPLRTVNALVGYPKLNKKVAAKGTPGSEDERNKAAAGLRRDRSGLGRRAYTGDQHYDVRREEEQMDEAIYDNKDHAQSITDKLKKKNNDGNYFIKADHGKHRIVHAYYSNSKVKKDIARLNEAELDEVEQMDESLDSIAKKHGMKYTTTAYGAGMKHPTKGEISINRYGEWHHKGTNKTGDSENDFSSLDKHLSTVKEEEQMDEVKLADLPRRKVVGKSYGADYVDPEGADETAADMKKAEPKRKSGPQGTMKRRFNTKSYAKLKSQYK